MSEQIKTWQERIKHHPDHESFAAIDAAKDEEIADLRAALAQRAPADEAQGAVARTTLAPMANEDGTVNEWYFDCDGHYIDVAKDADGKYSIFFKDRATKKEGWLDQADAQPTAEEVQERRESAGAAGAAQNSSTAPVPRTLENLLDRYWHIAHAEGSSGKSQGSVAQEVLNEIRAHFRTQPAAPVSGNAGEGADTDEYSTYQQDRKRRLAEIAQPKSAESALICKQCGTDRIKTSCPMTICSMVGTAHAVEHAKRAEPPFSAFAALYELAGEAADNGNSKQWIALRVEAIRAALQQAGGDALDAKRYRYIEDNATTYGGGKGFIITCWVPVDHEDMGCGIDAALAAAPTLGEAK